MRFNFLSTLSGALLVALTAMGCSAAAEEEETSDDAAITLEDGHKYFDRVQGDQLFLFREAEGSTFPYAPEELVGKNIVIHPLRADGTDGVMARATSVSTTSTHLVVRIRPLDLAEMAQATKNGDDTITIFRNPRVREVSQLPSAGQSVGGGGGGGGGGGIRTASRGPFDVELGLAPQNGTPSGLETNWPPVLSGFGTLTGNIAGYAMGYFTDQHFDFTPGLKAQWVGGRGLELSANFKLDTGFTLDVYAAAMAGAPVYEKVAGKDLLVLYRGGPVTLFQAPVLVGGVYSTVAVHAYVGCFANVEQKFHGTLKVSLGTTLSGSVLVQAGLSTPVDQWVVPGRTPFTATGHASGSFDVAQAAITPSVYCELPRVTVAVQPGGPLLEKLGGPQAYVGVVGRFYTSWDVEPGFRVQAVVGASVSPFGRYVSTEASFLTWRP